jgi:hypothetical protein
MLEREEDFSVEDDKEAVDTFNSLANSEYRRIIERLKEQRRREKILYMRSLPRSERLELKKKYGIK